MIAIYFGFIFLLNFLKQNLKKYIFFLKKCQPVV